MANEPPANPPSGTPQYQGLQPQIPLEINVPHRDLSAAGMREESYTPLREAGYKEEPYNPRKKHDEVRARVSYILLIFLGGTLLLSFAVLILTFFLKDQATAWGNAKDLLQVLIPTLTTLIGSIVGFYFGSQSQNPPDRQ